MGGRSRVAAQLLSGLGFREVYNLKGGIKAWEGGQAVGPQELNLHMVPAEASAGQVLEIAFCLENALQTFYVEMGRDAADRAMAELFGRLGGYEADHKRRLLGLRARTGMPVRSLEELERRCAGSAIMEGGFSAAELMRENAPFLHGPRELLDLSLMLETQALDLYLRFAGKCDHRETRELLHAIADEEKIHMAALGRLREEAG